MFYRVFIEDGLFKWMKPNPRNCNGQEHPVVDTTQGKWIDTDGMGVYPRDPKNEPLEMDKKGKPPKEDFIYVTDGDYRMYIGRKIRGRLQHSSFLAGAPISSAGSLKIKNGKALDFRPMSGHYRTKAESFQVFIDQLKDQGADLSEISTRWTKILLWGVERANTYHSFKKKIRKKTGSIKAKVASDRK